MSKTTNNCTAIATPGSEVCCGSDGNACSPQPPRTSRKSPWQWQEGGPWQRREAVCLPPNRT